MSLDPSLKPRGGNFGHKNVLTRAERIEKLKSLGKFEPGKTNALGLPKVSNRKLVTAKKK